MTIVFAGIEELFEIKIKEASTKHQEKGWEARFQAMKRFPLVENVGQVVVQDGRSADHGVSGSPSTFLV